MSVTPSKNWQSSLRSASVLEFSGHSRVSRVIRLGTCSRTSHVAIVCWVRKELLQTLWKLGELPRLAAKERYVRAFESQFVVFESTTMCTTPCLLMGRPVRGVQVHTVADRVYEYPGKVWLWPVLDEYALEQWLEDRLARFLLKNVGKEYDDVGAVISATHLTKWLLGWREDLNKVFCDELGGAAMKAISFFPPGNSSLRPPRTFMKQVRRGDFHGEPIGPIYPEDLVDRTHS